MRDGGALSVPPGTIRAAIIDLDGTLLDTAPDFHIAINRMRAELDLAPLPLAIIIRYVGKGTEHLVRCVLAVDLPEEQAQAVFAEALQSYHRHYHAINGEHAALFPEVHEGLAAMQAKGLKLACVTNKPIAFTEPLLARMGLRAYFSVVYGGDSLAAKKPDPLPLLQVCKDFDLPPHQVLAIGDSVNDAQAARAAGCPVFIVPYGYNHGEAVHGIDSDGIVQTLLTAAQQI
ncbi:MAG: phosphoglycolate phosphatase [Burkholderiaceae bacterium]|nr:phosphoglycolate phosphatase [Burkholderiaceae bacterium]